MITRPHEKKDERRKVFQGNQETPALLHLRVLSRELHVNERIDPYGITALLVFP